MELNETGKFHNILMVVDDSSFQYMQFPDPFRIEQFLLQFMTPTNSNRLDQFRIVQILTFSSLIRFLALFSLERF